MKLYSDNHEFSPYHAKIPPEERVTAIEKAEEWCVTKRRVLQWCKEGRIYGAKKVNGEWSIPRSAKKPYDDRHHRGIVMAKKYKMVLQYADTIREGYESQECEEICETWTRFVQDAVHHMHVIGKSTLTYDNVRSVLNNVAVAGKSIDDQIAARQMANALGYLGLCVARDKELSVKTIMAFRGCLQGDVADMCALVRRRGMLEILVERVNTYRSHPIYLAALFMVRFLRLQPFKKENEKVAFLVVNFILMKNGYPPIVIYRSLFSWLERYWTNHELGCGELQYDGKDEPLYHKFDDVDSQGQPYKIRDVLPKWEWNALCGKSSEIVYPCSRIDPSVLVGLFAKAVIRSCKVGFAPICDYLQFGINWIDWFEPTPATKYYIPPNEMPKDEDFDWKIVLKKWDSKKRRMILPKF